jgi:hypothetical protein
MALKTAVFSSVCPTSNRPFVGLKKVLSVTPVIEPARALTANGLAKFWAPVKESP